jgi:putative membrane protein
MKSPHESPLPAALGATEGSGAPVNESTLLARDRTTLAVERSFLAFERTLMAWLRTSMSMISFGFTLAKIFQVLEQSSGSVIVGRFGREWSPAAVGIAMVIIGTGSLVFATIQHYRRVKALRRHGLLPQWNLAFYVALLVTILGLFALSTLLLDF